MEVLDKLQNITTIAKDLYFMNDNILPYNDKIILYFIIFNILITPAKSYNVSHVNVALYMYVYITLYNTRSVITKIHMSLYI